jgi:hypothetical protein
MNRPIPALDWHFLVKEDGVWEKKLCFIYGRLLG